MGMILTINTNGTMINEELARFLGENKPRRVNITLYGASEKAYEELCHFPEGFDAAWKYIVEETDKILLSEQCGTCRMRSLCRTCAASALLETGNYEGTPEYMCRYTQKSLYLLQK